MESVESKITSKGQISVPAAVRRALGLTPGARIEWMERNGEVVVRRASRFSSQDIHAAVFTKAPEGKSVADMDAGIQAHLKSKHARD
ncbi:MAG TPA: type II toxin-antitoxin system PrlF family antitoxin [Oleiagrimonas sp.]|nr:type II toxin-antitoxin system PrlF family antitoxin [Oleiagrimonas sp.]